MSASIVNGLIQRLDGRGTQNADISETDVTTPKTLVRILRTLLADVAALKRRFAPRRITYRDVLVDGTGTKKLRFPHDFNGRAEYTVTSWKATAPPGTADLQFDSTSDARTLVLVSYKAGVASIRVEEAVS